MGILDYLYFKLDPHLFFQLVHVYVYVYSNYLNDIY